MELSKVPPGGSRLAQRSLLQGGQSPSPPLPADTIIPAAVNERPSLVVQAPQRESSEAYMSQGLLVLKEKELVALLWAGVLQDEGKMLNVSQGEAVL